jgi:dolichol-phosphate mannosyltransferase
VETSAKCTTHQLIMKTLSFVIPVYNSESSLNELCSSITSVMRSLDFEHEILLIDDCSTDGSWETIKKLSIQHKKIKGLKLSRNFGQHNAITAGIDKTEGDWVVFMDSDLQDDPNELPKFIKYTENDSNIIIGKRMTSGN